ncbi:AAA family ATPase [Pandoraea sp.]|uniref:AAA family ATPase n=1 Tax=Pandoraea sp. TaxID=1883445 RepID=UPI0011F601C5|nr:AAA family ATPase [Pandoraea sp.]TAL57058.1 MAG: pilus assembly protein [Pandoraea sp.]TAM18101.1 MAG: pilus assembly protein [Pandoraea sp.]
MIDILVISSDPEHVTEIEKIVAADDAHHRLRTASTGLAAVLNHPQSLAQTDLLIFDGTRMTPEDLDSLGAIAALRSDMACMLIALAPSADLLMRAMRAGVRDVQPWPIESDGMRQAIRRVAQKVAGNRREGQVVSFVSCKGGSGTSFLAANVAFDASMAGRRTLLFDLNQQFGEAAFLVSEQTPPATLADICAQIERLDAAFFDACVLRVSKDFDVLAGASDPAKAKEIKPEHVQRILNLVRHQYDLIVFDVGQSIGSVSIAALDQSSTIFAVLQLTLPYLRNGRRMLEIFRSLGYRNDKIRVLVNRYDKKGPIGLTAWQEALGVPVASLIPEDAATVADSINQGVPVQRLAKTSAVARSIDQILGGLSPQATPRSGIFGKLFAKPVLSKA